MPPSSASAAPLPRLTNAASGALYDALYTAVGLFLPALFVHFFALFPDPGDAGSEGPQEAG